MVELYFYRYTDFYFYRYTDYKKNILVQSTAAWLMECNRDWLNRVMVSLGLVGLEVALAHQTFHWVEGSMAVALTTAVLL